LIESKAGKYKSAAPLLMKATELEPKLKEAHYQLAMALQKIGKQDLARQEFSLYRSLTQSTVEEAARMGMEFERTTRPSHGRW